MQIYHKDTLGFWFFKKYRFFLENDLGDLKEMFVDEITWLNYQVGDYYDTVYHRFYKHKFEYNNESV